MNESTHVGALIKTCGDGSGDDAETRTQKWEAREPRGEGGGK